MTVDPKDDCTFWYTHEYYVATGSFNWSKNAETANAENLLVVRSPDLAAAYAANFTRRLAVSAPYVAAGTD